MKITSILLKADWRNLIMIKLLQGDCMELMNNIPNESIDLVLTDIPYNVVNREDNGLRKLDKENADILTFDLINFLRTII